MSGLAVRADTPLPGLQRPDVERFRDAIVQHIGLQFGDNKFAFLDGILRRRLLQLSSSAAGYLDRLEMAPRHSELAALARELTVGETYFFRHNDQFRALAEAALPDRLRAREAS